MARATSIKNTIHRGVYENERNVLIYSDHLWNNATIIFNIKIKPSRDKPLKKVDTRKGNSNNIKKKFF